MPKLLQRPALLQGEWWDSYVARVLGENGYILNSHETLEKLDPLVAEIAPPDARCLTQAGNTRGGRLRTYSGCTFPSWAVRGQRFATAYCPECYLESPYIRLLWRLRAVTHCEVHDRLLLTQCGACDAPVSLWDLRRRSCRCGASVVPPANIAAAQTSGQAGEPAAPDRRNWVFSAQHTSHLLTASDDHGSASSERVAMVVFLGHLLPLLAAVEAAQINKTDRTVHRFLDQLKLEVIPTLTWVADLWRALPSAAHLRIALKVVLRLHHKELAKPSDLSRLPLWRWAETLCSLGASPELAEKRGLIPVGSLKQGLFPAEAAARLAGLTSMQVYYLMKTGRIVPARTLLLGANRNQFSVEQVQELRQLRSKAYGYGHSLDLGIHVEARKVLSRAGIVSLDVDDFGRKWLDGVELRALLNDLRNRAKPLERVDRSKLGLGSKRFWQCRFIPALRSLFTHLRSGELKLWIWGDAPGFACFYVGPDAIRFLGQGAVCSLAASAPAELQPELPLVGGELTWVPTPQTWNRLPQLGSALSANARTAQPSLPMF